PASTNAKGVVMDRRAMDSKEYRELVAVVGEVRRRWRLKLAIRGLAALGVLVLIAFLLSTLIVGRLGYVPSAIVGTRIALVVLVLAALAVLVLRPMWRRVTDEQVALYLEEREPSLRLA